MASILLKKDYNDQKAGTVISVPFGVGKVLIRDGIGVRAAEADSHKADAKVPPHGPGGKGTEVKGTEVPKFPPQPMPSSPTLPETKKK